MIEFPNKQTFTSRASLASGIVKDYLSLAFDETTPGQVHGKHCDNSVKLQHTAPKISIHGANVIILHVYIGVDIRWVLFRKISRKLHQEVKRYAADL
jgi:hypothetical protein